MRLMRYALSFAFVLFAVASYAAQPYFSAVVSATDTNTNVTITGLPTPNSMAYTLIIINDGANEIYYDLTTGVATVSGAYIKSGESLVIDAGGRSYPFKNIGIICDTGETATVRIFAFPSI